MFGSEKFFGAGGGAASFYSQEIGNSLKFEDGDSSYLSRTPASAGNQKTWTFSAWFKRGNINADCMIFSASSNSSNLFYLQVRKDSNSNVVTVTWRQGSATTRGLTTNAVFRDSSSYYHVVLACDTTQSSASDRLKLYINGSEVTSFSLDNRSTISQSSDLIVNSANLHTIGAYSYSLSAYLDGYLAEVNFIDGTQLAASSFGETKEGIWIPKDPTGLTYGTNGFRLPFTETTTANGFNTVTYSGNGATQSVEGVGFKPDMVWLKSRSATYDHVITDSVRGVSTELIPNKTDAETTQSGLDLISFDNDGFTLKLGTSTSYNNSSQTYVGWCWGGGTNDKTYTVTVVSDSGNKYRFDGHGTSSITLELTEGATYTFNYPSGHPLRFSTTSDGTHGGGSEYTTGVTYVSSTQVKITVASGAPTLYYYCSLHSGMGGQINTNTTDAPTHAEGTILSRVKPNADYGFSIVSYTGTGSNATVGHGLGVAPKIIIIKDRGDTSTWIVYTEPTGNNNLLVLAGNTAASSTTNFQSTDPTSSVFSISGGGAVGGSSSPYIAYCFADVTGYQKAGTYTGNGSASGPTVTTGFRPSWVLIKRTDSSGEWIILDTTRDTDGSLNTLLYPSLSNAEGATSLGGITPSATGFQVTSTLSDVNASGGTFIYLAIADTRDALFTSDASGNSNNWTPNDLQHSDVMPDTPTNGFAVLNGNTSGGVGTLTEGNLVYQGASSQWESKIGTIGVSSGKWYYEVNPISGSSTQGIFYGIINMSDIYLNSYLGNYGNTWGYYGLNGAKYNNASGVSYGATVADGDIVGVALDVDAGTLTFYKNGVSQGVAFSGLSLGGGYDQEWFVGLSCYGTAKAAINFGQDSSFSGRLVAQGNADDNGKGDFYYAPPSGYLALCNANLPDPAIDPAAGNAPEDHFNTVLYTGTNGSQSVTGVGFQPDWVWWKNRSISATHVLMDSVRGANNALYSDLNNAEGSGWSGHSFDADGFTVDATYSGETNNNGSSFVAWNWKAGGTGVSNTDGSITSSVSANTDAGFSILTYTGTGSNATIGHGLDSAPEMIIIKKTSTTANWTVGHFPGLGNGKYQKFNTTDAQITASNVWNSTSPTSSVFSVGTSSATNTSGDYVAYCFSPKEGYSKFGTYTGNGSSNGPFVYTGFRPAFVIIKNASATEAWHLIDSERSPHNVANAVLYPNSSAAESNPLTAANTDFLSNGFKIRAAGGNTNDNNLTYIYMAFAEQPFKYSNAR